MFSKIKKILFIGFLFIITLCVSCTSEKNKGVTIYSFDGKLIYDLPDAYQSFDYEYMRHPLDKRYYISSANRFEVFNYIKSESKIISIDENQGYLIKDGRVFKYLYESDCICIYENINSIKSSEFFVLNENINVSNKTLSFNYDLLCDIYESYSNEYVSFDNNQIIFNVFELETSNIKFNGKKVIISKVSEETCNIQYVE